MPESFNLWTRRWMRAEGGGLVSIRDAMAQGKQIRQLCGITALETAGMLRLLAAIAQDIVRPRLVNDVRAWFVRGTFDGSELARWEANYAERLNLFGDQPFLQAVAGDILPVLTTKKEFDASDTVARLCPDVPTGTSVARNGERDERHLFCPACAARALTVPAPFIGAGGLGLRKSINGIAPMYSCPGGENLHEVIANSLVWPDIFPGGDIGYDDPRVPWRYDGQHVKDFAVRRPSLLHGLAFLPRRVRLYPEAAPGTCTRCGQKTDVAIRRIHFSQGERFEQGDERERFADPFVVVRHVTHKNKSWDSPVVPGRERGWQDVLLSLATGCQSPLMTARPDVTRWQFFGTGTDKAKYYHWFFETQRRPSKHLADGLLFAENLIGFAVSLLKDASAYKKKSDFIRAELWGLAYQPFRPILADDSPPRMVEWEQSLIDAVLDAHWLKARAVFPPAQATKNEMALMAWARDHRKWRDAANPPDEPGIGKILRQRGVTPREFDRLLAEPSTSAASTLQQYGIDTNAEKIQKMLAAWSSPREFVQRAWSRDYYYVPSKKETE